MTDSIYKEFENSFYNPDDNDKKPGDNDNWKSIQKGFKLVETAANEIVENITEEITRVADSVYDLNVKVDAAPPIFQQIGGGSFNSGTFAAHSTDYQEIASITNIDVLKSYLRTHMNEQIAAILFLVPGEAYNVNYDLDIAPVFTYSSGGGTYHNQLIMFSNIDNITGVAWRIINRTGSAYTISNVFGGASVMVGFVRLAY